MKRPPLSAQERVDEREYQRALYIAMLAEVDRDTKGVLYLEAVKKAEVALAVERAAWNKTRGPRIT